MLKSIISVLLFSSFFCSAIAWATGMMQQGLWEMTIKSDEMKAMKAMPKMSPQQLEQMRKMGVNIPQMQDGAIVTKMCVSKEMAESDQPPPQAQQKNSECQSKNFQRTGSTYSVDIVCNGPRLKGKGKSSGTYSGKNSFSSTYDFEGVANGKPVKQHHESSGKWLGADCGDVRPMSDYMNMQKK